MSVGLGSAIGVLEERNVNYDNLHCAVCARD